MRSPGRRARNMFRRPGLFALLLPLLLHLLHPPSTHIIRRDDNGANGPREFAIGIRIV